jgi:O-antigen/teichoic acid export membrane protein
MFKSLFRSEFSRNVLTLVTGTTIAQAIPVLVSPVLTRLYSPEDFGTFALFMSIVSGIVVIATARYELAILLPREDADATKLVILSFFICSGISLLSLLITAALMLLFHDISPWFLLIPMFIFLLGFYQIFVNWNNRKKIYSRIAFSRINNSIYGNAATLLFGFFKLEFIGLMLGNLTGLFVSNTIFVRKELKNFVKDIKQTKRAELKVIASRYKEMPLTNSRQALVDMFQYNGLIYLIPAFFSSAVLGLYSFGMRILQAPINLIGSSFAQVFFQRASEKYNNGENIDVLIKETVKKAALIALPVPIILLLGGQDLFAFVFSEKWRIAGLYAKILSPWIFFDFIRMTVSQTPIVLNKQKELLYISLIGTLVIIASMLYAGLISKDILTGFYSISALFSLLNIYIIFWIFRIGKKANHNKTVH